MPQLDINVMFSMLYWFLILFLYGYFIMIRYLLPKIYLNLFLRKKLIYELKSNKDKFKDEELNNIFTKLTNNIKFVDENNKYFITKLYLLKTKQQIIFLFWINDRILKKIEDE